MKRLLLLTISLCVLPALFAQITDTIIDSRDGQSYTIVLIGNQWWLSENMNYYTSTGSKYYDDDSSIYVNQYGRLYNFETANGICPSGWTLPTDSDWDTMEVFLGMDPSELELWTWRGSDQGAQIKVGGSSGFDATIGGMGDEDGSFRDEDWYGYYLSSTDGTTGTEVVVRRVAGTSNRIFRGSENKVDAFSVRCFKPYEKMQIQFTGTNTFGLYTSDGSINTMIGGGAPPYTYLWSNNETTANLSDLTAGVYSVEVTDARDSTTTDSVRVYSTLTDQRDWQKYKAVKIGDQLWMAENLKATQYLNTDPIPLKTSSSEWLDPFTDAYCYYDNNILNADTFGMLYNLPAVLDSRGLCPTDWHIPTDAEWTALSDELGGTAIAGGKMKETDTIHWKSPNTGATNESGFIALPGGYRSSGSYLGKGGLEYFWSQTMHSPGFTWNRHISYDGATLGRVTGNEKNGFAVRCIRDTIAPLEISLDGTGCTSFISPDGSVQLTVSGGLPPYSFLWSNGATTQNLTDVPGAMYSVLVTDFTNATVSDSLNIFTTFEDTRDGQVYRAVTIGKQIWMAENLNHGEYVESIVTGELHTDFSDNDTIEKYCLDNDTANCRLYGGLYDFDEARQYNDTMMQGVCPQNWHLPTDEEWKNLEQRIGMSKSQADALNWRGTDEGTKLKEGGYTGFDIMTPGIRSTGGDFGYLTEYGNFWTYDREATLYGYYRHFKDNLVKINRSYNFRQYGFSVRCLRNETPCRIESIEISKSNISCYATSDGAANLIVMGTGPMTYDWSNGATTQNITGLGPDWYSVTVTDSIGCLLTDSVVIVEPTLLEATITDTTNVTFFDGSDGTATVTPSGGTPGYSYLWDDDLSTTVSTVNGLSADKWYQVLVKDNNDCEARDSVILSHPGLPCMLVGIELIDSDITCFGEADGLIDLVVTGTGPMTYHWSHGPTSQNLTDLAPGMYAVTVTDSLSCSITDSSKILEPDMLQVNININSNVSAPGLSDGSASATPSGGTPSYSYLWDDDLTTTDSTVNGLSSNTSYHVEVMDVNSCTEFDSVKLIEPGVLEIVIDNSTNISCYSLHDGSATVGIISGNPPFTYQWNDDASTALDTVSNLSPNRWYRVTVTDQTMQTAQDSVLLSEPDPLDLTDKTYSPVVCPGSDSGSISYNVSGGTQPYTYNWITGATEKAISGLYPGKYYITVTDANTCTASDTTSIESVVSYEGQNICMVTVNEANMNLIVWERPDVQTISHFNIYKESIEFGYLLLGTVPYDDLSIFLDDSSVPDKFSHFYKISAVDKCGNESALSEHHKTMHLTANVGVADEVNLIWENYEGFPFLKYNLLRGSEPGSLSQIGILPNTITTYTDTDHPDGKLYYQIQVERPDACYPSGKEKAGTGPYRHALSNMDDNKKLVDGVGNRQKGSGINIYPNPAREILTVEFPNQDQDDYEILVSDLSGKKLMILNNITSDKVGIRLEGLSAGMYLIELRGPRLHRELFFKE